MLKIFFSKIKRRMGNFPERIFTDKLWAYKKAFKKVFAKKDNVKHIFGVSIKCKKHKLKHNNNQIERHHQDIKQRYAIMRCFFDFSFAVSFLELKRNIYNFVNPNLGLKGRTPAETSDLNLKLGQNKLLELIIYSAKRIDVSKR